MEQTTIAPRNGSAADATRPAIATRIRHVLTLGGRLGRGQAMIIWLLAAVGLSLYLGWSFVVAAGLASVVLGFLPCAAMCALGLCMRPGGKCSDRGAESSAPNSKP